MNIGVSSCSLIVNVGVSVNYMQLYMVAQINSKERTFAEALYQQFYSDKSEWSLIPKDKLDEIIQRPGHD